MLSDGDVILGKYQIDSLLCDSGGMADVYLGHNITLGYRLAIKQLKESLFANQDIVERFKVEAVAQSNIEHPGVVKVIDYDVENLCIVMEYIEGNELHAYISADLKTKIKLFIQVLDALSSAHNLGIIHRDLKPSNILVTKEGFAKIADFGIAKIIGEENKRLTKLGIGTPHYMSPEQIKGDEITGATDIYSLGVVMFEILTGVLPYEGKTEQMTAMMHLQNTPPTFNELGIHLPSDLERIVLKCLEKAPTSRYGDPKKLKNALEHFSQEQFATNVTIVNERLTRKTLIASALLLIFIVAMSGFAISGLSKGQGTLDVYTKEPADVYLDGEKIGSSPFVFQNQKAGKHTFFIEQPEFYRSKEREIVVEKGKVLQMIEAIPDGGSVSITSSRVGIDVEINGKIRAQTPTTIKFVRAG